MVRAAEELESHLGIDSHHQAHHVSSDIWENISQNVEFINILTGQLEQKLRTRICYSLFFCKIWNLLKTSVYVPYYMYMCIFTCLMQLAPSFKISRFQVFAEGKFISSGLDPVPCLLKGTVSRDFRLLVFFVDQFPPSIWVYHYGNFEFFRKFAEIFAAQGTPPVSTTPVANGKNLQAEKF